MTMSRMKRILNMHTTYYVRFLSAMKDYIGYKRENKIEIHRMLLCFKSSFHTPQSASTGY